MNEVVTDIKKLELETLKNLKNSKSVNTLRAYESDYKDFTLFCTKNNFSSIPTEPKILSLYLTHLSKTSKFSTLKRRIASISVVHQLKGYYLDTKHPVIRENLLGIKRRIGIFQNGKKPLLINHLHQLVNLIDDYKCGLGRSGLQTGIEGIRIKRRNKIWHVVGQFYEFIEILDCAYQILIDSGRRVRIGEYSDIYTEHETTGKFYNQLDAPGVKEALEPLFNDKQFYADYLSYK